MEVVAKEVFGIGTKKLDDYAYAYDYPKGLDDNWKEQLEYLEPAGVETVKARVRMPHMRYHGGRRLVSDPFPRKLIKQGPKREIADFEQTGGFNLVSEGFRDFVDGLERNVHQFEPVEVVWKDGSLAANMYIFVVCTALDSVSVEHTAGTRKLIKYEQHGNRELLGTWRDLDGRSLRVPVFDLSVIASKYIWQDEFLSVGALCAAGFKDAFERAGLKGMSFNSLKAV